ncbi:Cyclin-dependent kinase inhibitor [Cinara cedri]|uniref:Cyclin-dependent kinase inhibitor n=1 Tax=Cinara cedri TaxID=506608 RepID=A0A5E4N2Y6_9HEMI|nr:Cyclin-dependent kinase inhibitor [Cinara cedri]
MTVTFGVTVTGVSTDGGGSAAVNSSGRRVLAAKTDSVSNVNNNNNNNNNNNINNNNNNVHNNNNNNGPTGTPSITGKASVLSVRRVLFGPPADPAETRAWLDRQLCAAAASDSRAWNFDFVNERPLRDSPADRYLWERVCLPPTPAPPAQQQQPQRYEQQQADQLVCGVQRQRQSKVTEFMNQTKKRSLNAMMAAGSLKSNNKSNKVAGVESPTNKRSRRSIIATTMAI